MYHIIFFNKLLLIVFKEISWSTLAAEAATLYAVFFALPNYIYQMGVSNLSENAGKALELLEEVRLLLNRLFLEKKGKKTSVLPLYEAFERLNNVLELLTSDKVIKEKLPWIKNAIDIFKNDLSNSEPNESMKIFFANELGKDWYNKTEFQSLELKTLKDRLQEIYSKPYKVQGIPKFFKENRYFFLMFGTCALAKIILSLYYSV